MTFKRWATLQGTSAGNHTRQGAHTNSVSLPSTDEQTGGQDGARMEMGALGMSEINTS